MSRKTGGALIGDHGVASATICSGWPRRNEPGLRFFQVKVFAALCDLARAAPALLWLAWQGLTFVRTAQGMRPTADEDGYILVLPTPTSPHLDLSAPISCEARSGDAC